MIKNLGKVSTLKLRKNVRIITLISVLLFLWTLFTFFTSSFFTDFTGSFLSARNLSNLMRQMAIVGIMSSSMVLVIVTGGIDMSVGSVMGFCGVIAAYLMRFNNWPILGAIMISVLFGVAIGFLQGEAIARTGVPPFIVTLSAQLIFRGAVVGITKGSTIAPLPDSFLFIGQSYIIPFIGYVLATISIISFIIITFKKRKKGMRYGLANPTITKNIIEILGIALFAILTTFVLNKYRGIPTPVIILAIAILTFTIISEKTKFGRKVYALGGNMSAARYSGINVERTMTIVYTLNGLMAAIAGLILAARLNAGTVSSGEGFELDAIASCVIGGTSMSGGTGKVSGAILGALIMATITNGMSMMNLESYLQSIVKGSILFLAVLFDMMSTRRTKKVVNV